MKIKITVYLFLLLFSLNLFAQIGQEPAKKPEIKWWLTELDQSALFKQQSSITAIDKIEKRYPTIEINTSEIFQTIDGFGFTLTGGSAIHINSMSKNARQSLLKELFGTNDTEIGISYLRISIGASDLSDHVYSYDDIPLGQADPNLEHFNIDMEKKDLIPVLKQILEINPNVSILGSPWSAPAWMKDNNDSKGGSLKPEYFEVYAMYFVKYIKAMKNEGINIKSITIQNEPLHPGNNPSMFMSADDQRLFLKNYLGPAFERNNIKTKIVLYDHNADRIDYPISILNDIEARKYADGSAFHLYAGEISELTNVHNAHPDKNIYFTEQWIGAPSNFAGDFSWHINNLIIGGTRNWCKTVLEWNLSSNPQLTPHTDRGGCSNCLGGITIDGDKVIHNPG
jgi:glucosylceramidase